MLSYLTIPDKICQPHWISHQLSQYLHFVNLIALSSISENATQRSYHALLHHAPMVKTLMEGGDTYALEALYINVSQYFPSGKLVTYSSSALQGI